MTQHSYDVVIMGAGMAGLTLARQLKQRRQDLSIVVVEHRKFPVPEAAYKVGESTVEIAAHYLSEVLGLQQHLETEQLPKFGLRLFVGGEEPITTDISDYDEIGVSKVLPVPTYQIDRGRLENYLASACRTSDISLFDATTVRRIELTPGAHRVVVRNDIEELTLQSRYLVDTSGRRGWLRQQQDLSRPTRHANHAVWCRVEGPLNIDAWSDNAAWLDRCPDSPRRLSTNHFAGVGYWLWLIPLASGATSIGLVFDPKFVDRDEVNRFDRLVMWLTKRHPLIAAEMAERVPLDFHTMESYAKGCKQLFDPNGWMISGDAGVFADPFYSPGADFIAFANLFITDLIANDQDASMYKRYQDHFMAFFSNTLSLYRGQYGGFGHSDMLVLKTIWDYSYYWGPLAKLFFSQRCVDLDFMQAHQPALFEAATLNASMQRAFRTFARQGIPSGGHGRFYDHHCIDYFHALKHELLALDHPQVGQQLNASVQRLGMIAETLQGQLAQVIDGGAVPDLAVLGQEAAFA